MFPPGLKLEAWLDSTERGALPSERFWRFFVAFFDGDAIMPRFFCAMVFCLKACPYRESS